MKKISTLLMAAVFLFSMAISSFAQEATAPETAPGVGQETGTQTKTTKPAKKKKRHHKKKKTKACPPAKTTTEQPTTEQPS